MQSVNVIFVCLGNICRSPAAEGIFKSKVEAEGLEGVINIDSAGTSAYHIGEKPDKRMIKQAALRGYDLQSLARKFEPHKDYEKFDYIIAMDAENFNNLSAMDIHRKYRHKIHLITDFCTTVKASEVPDPYYGNEKAFDLVITILEDACIGLLENIQNDTGINKK